MGRAPAHAAAPSRTGGGRPSRTAPDGRGRARPGRGRAAPPCRPGARRRGRSGRRSRRPPRPRSGGAPGNRKSRSRPCAPRTRRRSATPGSCTSPSTWWRAGPRRRRHFHRAEQDRKKADQHHQRPQRPARMMDTQEPQATATSPRRRRPTRRAGSGSGWNHDVEDTKTRKPQPMITAAMKTVTCGERSRRCRHRPRTPEHQTQPRWRTIRMAPTISKRRPTMKNPPARYTWRTRWRGAS